MKRNVFFIVVALSTALCAATASAEGDGGEIPLISDAYPNALGFSFGTNASPVSIFNMHYQRWIGTIGLDASIGAAKELNGAGTWGADVLVSFQYCFSSGNLTDDGNLFGALYGFARSGFVAQVRQDMVLNPDTNEFAYTNNYYQYVPVAVGVGIEAVFFKHLSLPLEVGFEYRVLTEDFGPTFSGSLRYRF